MNPARVRSFLLAVLISGIISPSFSISAGNWKQAVAPRNWSFPRDHGAHRDYRTEWWYFTGNLVDEEKRQYGYQLTFFRQGVQKELKKGDNSWRIRDIYLAHFALSDISGNSFRFFEQASRTGPGLAGADGDSLNVWCLKWSARMEQERIRLTARRGEVSLDLELVPVKPLILHGKKGLSRKGMLPGQGSYYYSFTALQTTGSITRQGAAGTLKVTGTSWFDQEFSSNQLAREQVGWDWFALRLSDGREVMLYLLRRRDGTIDPASSGTLIEKNGTSRQLQLSELGVKVIARWKSPLSGGVYPSRWRIRIPTAAIELEVATKLADQELRTTASTGVTYYEGAVGGKGKSAQGAVDCEGYVEMTGYAGALGGMI